MIVKLIFLVLIIWFGLRVYQTIQAKKVEKISSVEHTSMVSCDTCGIHVPQDEALIKGEKHYCSLAHLPK